MVVQKLLPTLATDFSVTKNKNDYYFLQCNATKPEIQTRWMTITETSLPSAKYVKDSDVSLSLTCEVQPNDDEYYFFDAMDTMLAFESLLAGKELHKFIIPKNSKFYIRFKLYKTTKVFLKRSEQPVKSIMDFYEYLKPGAKMRAIFTFTKSWNMNGKLGFSCAVEKIQLEEDNFYQSKLNETKFTDSD